LLNHPLINGYKNACRIVEQAQKMYPQYIRLH